MVILDKNVVGQVALHFSCNYHQVCITFSHPLLIVSLGFACIWAALLVIVVSGVITFDKKDQEAIPLKGLESWQSRIMTTLGKYNLGLANIYLHLLEWHELVLLPVNFLAVLSERQFATLMVRFGPALIKVLRRDQINAMRPHFENLEICSCSWLQRLERQFLELLDPLRVLSRCPLTDEKVFQLFEMETFLADPTQHFIPERLSIWHATRRILGGWCKREDYRPGQLIRWIAMNLQVIADDPVILASLPEGPRKRIQQFLQSYEQQQQTANDGDYCEMTVAVDNPEEDLTVAFMRANHSRFTEALGGLEVKSLSFPSVSEDNLLVKHLQQLQLSGKGPVVAKSRPSNVKKGRNKFCISHLWQKQQQHTNPENTKKNTLPL